MPAHRKYSVYPPPGKKHASHVHTAQTSEALRRTRVVFVIIHVALLKTNSGRYGIEGLKNMVLSSFNFLSGGDGGQRVPGIQPGSAGTVDLQEKSLWRGERRLV